MIPVYKPDQVNFMFGVPGSPLLLTLTDWVSVTSEPGAVEFDIIKGVNGEPFLEASTDSSRVYNLTILPKSKNIEDFHNIYLAQKIGIVGFPFSIIDNSIDNIVPQNRQRTLYPVGVLMGRPPESFELRAKPWVYKIKSPLGQTIYF